MPLPAETTALLDEIRALLDAPAEPERAPFLARLEQALTAGYAQVLALEAERGRLERRIGEVAAGLGDEVGQPEARELSALARRLSSADRDLSHLRGQLSTLRERLSLENAAQLPRSGSAPRAARES